jgi:hypothetical protein
MVNVRQLVQNRKNSISRSLSTKNRSTSKSRRLAEDKINKKNSLPLLQTVSLKAKEEVGSDHPYSEYMNNSNYEIVYNKDNTINYITHKPIEFVSFRDKKDESRNKKGTYVPHIIMFENGIPTKERKFSVKKVFQTDDKVKRSSYIKWDGKYTNGNLSSYKKYNDEGKLKYEKAVTSTGIKTIYKRKNPIIIEETKDKPSGESNIQAIQKRFNNEKKERELKKIITDNSQRLMINDNSKQLGSIRKRESIINPINMDNNYFRNINFKETIKKEEIKKPKDYITIAIKPKFEGDDFVKWYQSKLYDEKQDRLKEKQDAPKGVGQFGSYDNTEDLLNAYKRGIKGFTDEMILNTLALGYDIIPIGKNAGKLYFKIPLKQTGKNIVETVKNPKETFEGIKNVIKTDPEYAIGTATSIITKPFIINEIGKIARNTVVPIGKTKLNAKEVFDVEVLEGKKTFPTTKSIEESIKRFKATKENNKLIGAHATGKNLKGKSIDLQKGTHSAKLMEDPGLYITPKGEASPFFLRVDDTDMYNNLKFKLIPEWKNPQLVEIEFDNIRKYSKNILQSEGFEEVVKAQQKAKVGDVFITKRSTGRFDNKVNLGKGGSTAEIEAVVPIGTKISKKGSKYYTNYKGTNIPIKRYIIKGKDVVPLDEFSKVSNEIIKNSDSFYTYNPYNVEITPLNYLRPSKLNPSYTTGTNTYSGLTSKYNYDEKSYVKPRENYNEGRSSKPLDKKPRRNSRREQRRKPKKIPPRETERREPKRPYTSSTSIRTSERIIPPPTRQVYTPYTPNKIVQPKNTKSRGGFVLDYKKVDGFQPIYNDNGRKVKGKYYGTKIEAVNEGMYNVDNTPIEDFKVKLSQVELNKLKNGTNKGRMYKFAMKNGNYVEKNKYRYDKRNEKFKKSNFNFLKYMR